MQRSLDRLDYKISMYEQELMRVEKRLQKQQEARETACGA